LRRQDGFRETGQGIQDGFLFGHLSSISAFQEFENRLAITEAGRCGRLAERGFQRLEFARADCDHADDFREGEAAAFDEVL
jgi:hypothetical protein